MKKHVACFCIVTFLSCNLFSQVKFSIYRFGLDRQSCDGRTTISNDIVFQFFCDSTFTLTEYKRVSKLFSQIRKTEIKGSYIKKGDTLFLNEGSSRFFPFIKDNSKYVALAKDAALRLFPATIIVNKGECFYTSYLNIPREIKQLDYCQVSNLEMQYVKNQDFSKAMFFPQISNKIKSIEAVVKYQTYIYSLKYMN